MVLVLFIPALLGGFVNWVSEYTKESHKISSNEPDKVHMNISTDEEYKHLVQGEIQKVMNDDLDTIGLQILKIQERQELYGQQMDGLTSLLTEINRKLDGRRGPTEDDRKLQDALEETLQEDRPDKGR